MTRVDTCYSPANRVKQSISVTTSIPLRVPFNWSEVDMTNPTATIRGELKTGASTRLSAREGSLPDSALLREVHPPKQRLETRIADQGIKPRPGSELGEPHIPSLVAVLEHDHRRL